MSFRSLLARPRCVAVCAAAVFCVFVWWAFSRRAHGLPFDPGALPGFTRVRADHRYESFPRVDPDPLEWRGELHFDSAASLIEVWLDANLWDRDCSTYSLASWKGKADGKWAKWEITLYDTGRWDEGSSSESANILNLCMVPPDLAPGPGGVPFLRWSPVP